MADTIQEQQETFDSQPPNPSVLEEAQSLLVQGKRCMALGDYQAATDSLEQAVQLYDAYYGVGKIQSADAYLEYGTALVALANLEAGTGTDKIMKKAGIEEEEEDEDEDEDDGDEDQEDEEGDNDENSVDDNVDNKTDAQQDPTKQAPTENGTTTTTKENGEPSQNGQVAPMETSPIKSAPDSEPTPGTSSGNVVGSNDKESMDEEDENDDATTIEIAWEVLCLAKRLFMTDESLEGRLKLAETLQKLGEISIEWENNENAISILEECLNIRKAILPPEDRLIALTYHNLGLAHSFKSDTQNANESFQNAVNVIEKRIETLTKELATAKDKQDTVAASAHEKEINELKELLPDMKMRLDDSKEDGEQTSEVLKRTREEIQQEDEEVKKVCLDKTKPVDDISHLVKRKT